MASIKINDLSNVSSEQLYDLTEEELAFIAGGFDIGKFFKGIGNIFKGAGEVITGDVSGGIGDIGKGVDQVVDAF